MPDTAGELNDDAEDIERSPTVFMDEWNEENAANGKTSVIDSGRSVQDVDRDVVFLDDWSPSCKANIELDEGPKNIIADKSVIDSLPLLGPVLSKGSVLAEIRVFDLPLPMDHSDQPTEVVEVRADQLADVLISVSMSQAGESSPQDVRSSIVTVPGAKI